MTGLRLAIAFLCAVTLSSCTGAEAQMRRPTATLTTYASETAARPGREIRLAVKAVMPSAAFHVQANKPREEGLIPTVLTIDAPPGVTLNEVVYPAPTDFRVAGFDQPLLVYGQEFVVGVRATLAASVPTGSLEIPGRLRYQACDDLVCYTPITIETRWTLPVVNANASVTPQHPDVFKAIAFGKGIVPPVKEADEPPPAPAAITDPAGVVAALDRFELRSYGGGFMGVDPFLQLIADAETGTGQTGWFDGRGPLAIVAIVLLGGLALNLTPCVLPMIPINLAIIGAGARAGSRRRGFVLGASYGVAMTVVYGLLGLVVILTAGAFGTINSSPWFNLVIAAVFIVLGLAMFDVIVIDLSKFSSAFQPSASGQGSVTLAFTMGGVAALLAGACVAPVVIQVVLFASELYAGGTQVALALPFVLGIGMAIPWPIAGAGMAALPKPGAWMVRVKQAFGVVILATAAYYGYLSYSLFADRRVEAGDVTSSVAAMVESGWHSSLAAGLAEARREGKPVLLDLWATWCKNCLVMDQTTLKDAAVVNALHGYVKIKVQSEDLEDPTTSALMQRINAVGLPAYAILVPQK